MRTIVSAVVLALLLGGAAYPHDIWLLPNRFQIEKGEMLVVRQLTGSDLQAEDEIELLRRMTPRFELVTVARAVDLMEGSPSFRDKPVIRPVLERKIEDEGQVLLAMDHAFIHGEFTTEKFLEYLEHEGFSKSKYQPLMPDRPQQRERYARTLKCLVQVGKRRGGDLHKKALGQKLEILLLENPYELKVGEELSVQVLFDGKPSDGELVTAFSKEGQSAVKARRQWTDARGSARFELDSPGLWLIRLVHLTRDQERSDVDWESHWAAYSFWVE